MNPWATPQAYNNMKDFFETGVSWSNNVNVAQRFDKGNYSFSLGNTTSNGIVPSTGMDRYNVKMSAEAQLHPNWTTGFNGNFVTSKSPNSLQPTPVWLLRSIMHPSAIIWPVFLLT